MRWANSGTLNCVLLSTAAGFILLPFLQSPSLDPADSYTSAMLATLSLLALASAAVAAPVVQRAVAEVTGNTTSSVAWYLRSSSFHG